MGIKKRRICLILNMLKSCKKVSTKNVFAEKSSYYVVFHLLVLYAKVLGCPTFFG
jgi:hypothetical protein